MVEKVLIIEKCNYCRCFESNMYHGACCWHDKVSKPHPEGKIPKKIKRVEYLVDIPKWCPLEDNK